MESGTQSTNVHAVSHAMLSVYYQTVGRQFEVRGAPSVFLPPEVQPISLSDALDVLRQDAPNRLREALWRIVRSVPAIQVTPGKKSVGFGGPQSYPDAMLPYFRGDLLQLLSDRRRDYRRYANLFSAALIAFRDGSDPEIVNTLIELLDERGQTMSGRGQVAFSHAITAVLGDAYLNRLKDMASPEQPQYSQALGGQIARIETEIGCSIQEFVEGIADAAAFDEIMTSKDMQAIIGIQTPENRGVYPICTVVRQNTQDLVTSATSTSVVVATFDDICSVVDPDNWDAAGSIVDRAHFVDHPFDLRTVASEKFGTGVPALLREWAQVSWSGDPDQQATFQNVLNVVSSIRDPGTGQPRDMASHDVRTAEVRYNLCRSIDSTVLWDHRAGGLLVDQGFIKVRPLGSDRWQVTMRKEVQFSDRTPYVGGRGWRDFGQLANYLAPATLTWWLECDTYRIGQRHQNLAPSLAGSSE